MFCTFIMDNGKIRYI